MKDSKEKEHRISNLKDLINNVKEEEVDSLEDVEEDIELINYLNEDKIDFDKLEIDDEFIYHPGDESEYAIDLEENPIDEDYIINTPKSEDFDEESEVNEVDGFADDFTGEISENIDNLINAKIGKTPILAIISTTIGVILLGIAAFLFNSRSDRVIDNVVSGETTFIVIIFVIIGLLLIIYGLYKILGFRNPLENMMNAMDSVEKENDDKKDEPEEKIIPKSNIPLNKDSYKIGEFNMDDLQNKLKKPTASKPKTTPAEEKVKEDASEEKSEDTTLTSKEIEELEYEQVKLDTETIDDIFAEVEDLDELDIISVDSKEDKK